MASSFDIDFKPGFTICFGSLDFEADSAGKLQVKYLNRNLVVAIEARSPDAIVNPIMEPNGIDAALARSIRLVTFPFGLANQAKIMSTIPSVTISSSSEPESNFEEGPQTFFQVFMTGTVLEQCTTPEEIAAKKERMAREEAARRQCETADDETEGEDPPPPPLSAPQTNIIGTSRVRSGTPATAGPALGAPSSQATDAPDNSPGYNNRHWNRGGRNRHSPNRALNMDAIEVELNGARVFMSLVHNIVGVKQILNTIPEEVFNSIPGLQCVLSLVDAATL